jgi:nicotinate dehydrogenase subunit B
VNPAARTAGLPPSVAANPRLGAWLRVLPAGVVEVRPGKVELGQGVLTALSQVAAEELDVGVARVRMIPAATGVSPDEGYTAGSLSVQHSGSAIRLVCAEARGCYLGVAAARLGVPESKLTVSDGQILAPDGRSTSYWELADDALLDRTASGEYPPKSASAYHIVGTSVPRLDLPDKLTGRPRFVHDLSPDGLCYGRIVRPPSRGATLTALDTRATLALPGVLTVVRDGSFLGVVAEREELAVRAADRLRAGTAWERHPTLPDPGGLPAYLRSAPAETTVLAECGTRPDREQIAMSVEATYHRPYLAHASIGPSSATALFGGREEGQADGREGSRLQVWSHTQGIYLLRAELARALGLADDDVTVTHVEGPGCYGHNGADDAAMDAALLAMAVPGRPVQVVWSRADELAWAPFGTAAVVRVAADVDAAGNVLSWHHEIWGNGHSTRPGSTRSVALLANSHRVGGEEIEAAAEPPMAHGGGAGRNSVPDYDFPACQAVNHRLLDMPLRTSALRSLGAFLNVFAAESFMDELALAAGRDPVEYRLGWLSDPRARAVIESAAARSGWDNWSPAESAGHGIGFARYKNTSAYCAVVAEVEAVSEVRVRRLTIAVDAGLVINPDGAANQVEGGAVQATSWALKEQVRFDRYGVTGDTWETYPILRFSEVPVVDVELLPGNGNPALGVGETAQGPTAAAIGNAVCDALGVRVRALPFTEENILAAMPD